METLTINHESALLEKLYNNILSNSYTDNELCSLETLKLFVKSGNMKVIVAVEGCDVVAGIVYRYMPMSEVVYIAYLSALNGYKFIGMESQLVTLALLCEDTDGCIVEVYDPTYKPNNESAELFHTLGFNRLCVNYIQPKLTYNKEPVQGLCLSVYNEEALPVTRFMNYMVELYKEVMMIPNPEKDEIFCNVRKEVSGKDMIATCQLIY